MKYFGINMFLFEVQVHQFNMSLCVNMWIQADLGLQL